MGLLWFPVASEMKLPAILSKRREPARAATPTTRAAAAAVDLLTPWEAARASIWSDVVLVTLALTVIVLFERSMDMVDSNVGGPGQGVASLPPTADPRAGGGAR